MSVNRRKILIGVAIAMLAVVAFALAMVPKSAIIGPLPASGAVSNLQLRSLVTGGARLVDVRTAAEFGAGHIEGAENVPIDQVPTASGAWDKAAPVVVYCATGSRSANAFGYLDAQGFSHVYDLTAGIAAWDGATVTGVAKPAQGGLPVTGKPTMYDFAGST